MGAHSYNVLYIVQSSLYNTTATRNNTNSHHSFMEQNAPLTAHVFEFRVYFIVRCFPHSFYLTLSWLWCLLFPRARSSNTSNKHHEWNIKNAQATTENMNYIYFRICSYRQSRTNEIFQGKALLHTHTHTHMFAPGQLEILRRIQCMNRLIRFMLPT